MRLENAMRAVRNERAVVVLHYAPILDTVDGEPLEIFPFLGSSRLSETIDRCRTWSCPSRSLPGPHASRRAGLQGGVPGREIDRPPLCLNQSLRPHFSCRDSGRRPAAGYRTDGTAAATAKSI